MLFQVAQAAAYTLGIDLGMIKIKASSTLTGPNDGPTGGSMASDGVTMVNNLSLVDFIAADLIFIHIMLCPEILKHERNESEQSHQIGHSITNP